MKHISKALLQIAVVLTLITAIGFAQESTTVKGGLSGTITDSTGAIVPGATVTVSGPQGTRTFTTDSQGRYTAGGLTPGLYDLTVEKSGFK